MEKPLYNGMSLSLQTLANIGFLCRASNLPIKDRKLRQPYTRTGASSARDLIVTENFLYESISVHNMLRRGSHASHTREYLRLDTLAE